MKKLIVLLFGIVFMSATMMSCGGSKNKKQEDTTKTEQVAPVNQVDEATMMAKGKELYTAHCTVCHMPEGQGVPNTFPPLASSDYLIAHPEKAVDAVLNGLDEAITVNGTKYNIAMAPINISKEEALYVVNYTLKNFGNNGKLLTMDDISHINKK